MKWKSFALITCCSMMFLLTTLELHVLAASVETSGVLNATGGVRFPDGRLQTAACSACEGVVVPISLGGTNATDASTARTNLGVPGLITPNTFTADQTFQGDISLSGNLTIPDSTSTTGIIMSEDATLMHTYGDSNFFAGRYAGNLTMTGGYNTGIGARALFNNTSGNYNTGNGFHALLANTTGYDNTASGVYALTSNTAGYRNTAYGLSSLRHNTIGAYNVASGYRALYNNTTAAKNTALGANALYSQSFDNSGSVWDSENTAIGYEALYSNQPITNTTGAWNTAIGSTALRSNNTGFYNTATGTSALYNNQSGIGNTASGYWALHNNVQGVDNSAIGRGAGGGNTSGSQNTYVGAIAGFTITTGSNNTFVGYDADASANNLTNATAIGYGAVVNASNKVRIGNTSVEVIEGQVAWSIPSDSRLKRDIYDISKGIEFIRELRPVQFRMKEGNERIDFGFIAQDVEALLGTDYNVLGIGQDSDRTLSLRYTDFIAPMVKAIQEQQEIIEMQKGEIKEQKDEIRSQNDEIEALKNRLSHLEALVTKR